MKVAFHEYIALAHDVRERAGRRTKAQRRSSRPGLDPAYFRTLIVIVISSWSVQTILYVPATVSLRLNE